MNINVLKRKGRLIETVHSIKIEGGITLLQKASLLKFAGNNIETAEIEFKEGAQVIDFAGGEIPTQLIKTVNLIIL